MSRTSHRLAVLLLAVAVTAPALAAQTTIPPEDYGKWESLAGATLSPDGSWIAVQVSRVDEENELRVRPVANPDSVVVVKYGSRPAFSDDGRWLAYAIGMSPDARERLREQRKPVREELGILDVATGAVDTLEAIQSFAFSSDGRFLAMRGYPPEGERDFEGVDLVVRDLSDGRDTNFGNVAEFAWQDEGPLLAMVVDAREQAGNGLQVYDPGAGRLVTLDSEPTRYSGLSWRKDADDLVVLRRIPMDAEGEKAWSDTAQVALAFRGLERGPDRARRLELAPGAEGFPADHRIVSFRAPRWSEDGSLVLVGLRERVPAKECGDSTAHRRDSTTAAPDSGSAPPVPAAAPSDSTTARPDSTRQGEGGPGDASCAEADDEDRPTVEIWNARDVDIVPTQKVRADRDRRENRLAAWRVDEARLVHLEDDEVESVQLVEGAPMAVGLDDTPYEGEAMFGPAYRDVYLVDLATGERRKVLERVQFFNGMSPGGRYLLYVADGDYHAWDVRAGEDRNLTADLGPSFVDLDDDHPVDEKPPYGMGGWLEGDRAVLLYDEFDAWRVAPDGSGAERLTRGAEANVRHRRVRLDPEERAIDPDRPQYFSLYDDWAEAWGYGRADELGDEVERLVWKEAQVGRLEKAEDAEVYGYVVSDFDDSPDLFVGGPELEGAVQVTRTNPFMGDYLWGKAELVTYVNEWGDTLQGSLYYPAGWEAGKTYPMITYIYEIRSNAVRSFLIPSERNYYDMQAWVQEGYFVFQPDIVYRDREPGTSAVANIVPAVKAVLATGMVDPDRVGLIGHSWGGYQTAFVPTQTDIFAAAVAGAPLTNLFSMYLSVYWNSGGTDARIFEISQGRMEVPFWEDVEAYRRNSPVFHVESLHTPMLMAQGSEDGAVDFNQGVEYYNAARRAGKDFVFLVYNGENHGFREEANQKDYHRRILEWFGHYLKGEPAPAWITEGVPFLEQPGGQPRDRPEGGGR